MLDRRIRLRHLACFLAAVQHETIGAAAEAIGMTQPAASKTLKELEAILGARLFERSRRGVRLTGAGEIFRRHAEAGLAAIGEGAARVAQGRQGTAELVRVGALPTVAARLMPDAVERFAAASDGAVVRVVSGTTAFLLGDLRADRLDLVVGRMAEGDAMSGLTFEHLYSETIAFVVRPGHPLAAEPAPSLGAIAFCTVVVPPQGAIIRPALDRLLAAQGVLDLPRRVETVSPSFGRAFTSRSDAVWAISEGAVEDELERGTLVRLRIEARDTSGPVGLTLRAGSLPGPAASLLIEAIRESARSLRGRTA